MFDSMHVMLNYSGGIEWVNEQNKDKMLFFRTIFVFRISFVNYKAYHLFNLTYQSDASLN